MKSNFDGSSSKFASVLSDFVEEQKNKDLLDVSHRISISLDLKVYCILIPGWL